MNGVGEQREGEEPHGPLRLETESRNGHGVEIAVPRPQPPECGRHVMSPRCEPHEGDPAAQQPPGGYGDESADAGDQEEADSSPYPPGGCWAAGSPSWGSQRGDITWRPHSGGCGRGTAISTPCPLRDSVSNRSGPCGSSPSRCSPTPFIPSPWRFHPPSRSQSP